MTILSKTGFFFLTLDFLSFSPLPFSLFCLSLFCFSLSLSLSLCILSSFLIPGKSSCSRTESEIVPGELLTLDVVDRIKTCLLQGCRSIKIDCFDGPEGPLVSTRSSTLQTHSLDQLLEAINENAFTNSS